MHFKLNIINLKLKKREINNLSKLKNKSNNKILKLDY